MSRVTKKYMVENFAQVQAERELLWLYLCDTTSGKAWDARAKESNKDGSVQVELYRATCASGGYVVIVEGSYPSIMLLDDANRKYRDSNSVYSLPLRICLERVTGDRGRLLDEKYGKVEVSA